MGSRFLCPSINDYKQVDSYVQFFSLVVICVSARAYCVNANFIGVRFGYGLVQNATAHREFVYEARGFHVKF